MTTAPSLLNTTATDVVAGQSLLLRPVGGSVDIGGSGVATGAGFLVNDGEAVTLDSITPGEGVYAIAASGTVTVHVFESGL